MMIVMQFAVSVVEEAREREGELCICNSLLNE
jgi:hypothetical protein